MSGEELVNKVQDARLYSLGVSDPAMHEQRLTTFPHHRGNFSAGELVLWCYHPQQLQKL